MADYVEKYSGKASDELEKQIRQVYKQAAEEVQKKLDDFIRGHKARNAQMLQMVSDGKISKQDYQRWMRGQVFQGDQWKQKLKDVTDVYVHADEKAREIVGGTSKNVFMEAANYTAYDLEKGMRGAVAFNVYDAKTVERLLKKDPKMLPEWKIDQPKDYKWNEKRVRNAVAQGIIQGESVEEVGDRLTGELATSNATKMDMFARTAVNGAQNAGRMDRLHEAEEMGIEVKKKWLATLDQRTRDTHQALDGQEQPIDEPFVVDGMKIDYPGDPFAPPELVYNCRCTLTYVYPKYQHLQHNHERRDQLNDKNVENMTYYEWLGLASKNDRKQEEPEPEESSVGRKIVQGKDITETWERRPDQFAFEIEDVVNAQGFDGLPKIVSKEEFDKAVRESEFVAQRAYSAPDQETLDAYRDQLYNGKWYIDCSVGGARHGQGMYCVADYSGKITDEMQSEMSSYAMMYGERPAYIETFTVSKDFKIVKESEIKEKLSEYNTELGKKAFRSAIDELINNPETVSKNIENYKKYYGVSMSEAEMKTYMEGIQWSKQKNVYGLPDNDAEKAAKRIAKKYKIKEHSLVESQFRSTDAYNESMKSSVYDIGSFATMNGYDGIEVSGRSEEDAPYLVILNRTKCIFLNDELSNQEEPQKQDEVQEQKIDEKPVTPEHDVAEGKNITETWERRPSQFKFEIEDVMNTQGFDGLPQVLSRSEFDAAVKAANGGKGFIAQRTYSAPDQAVLDAYRAQLYGGKWYVDCSVGTAAYGQGMYATGDFNGQITENMQKATDFYIGLNEQKGSSVAATEVFTLQADAKIADYEKLYSEFTKYGMETQDKNAEIRRTAVKDASKELADKILKDAGFEEEYAKKFFYGNLSLADVDWEEMGKAYKQLGSEGVKKMQELQSEYYKKQTAYVDEYVKEKSIDEIKDIGAFATALGYDAIEVKNHGIYDTTEVVVLNRTKCIFLDPESKEEPSPKEQGKSQEDQRSIIVTDETRKQVSKSTASDDWFEYDYAKAMSEYIKTGEMPTRTLFTFQDLSQGIRRKLAAEAELIQETGEKTKTEYKTTYRGMVLSEDDVKALKTGSKHTFDTLTASTPDKKLASVYTDVGNNPVENGVPVIFEIQKPDGIYAFDREKGTELVLPRGSTFRIERKYTDEDGVVHISLYSKKGNNIVDMDADQPAEKPQKKEEESKQTEETKDESYQYHATTAKAIIGIAEKGLQPNRGHVGKGIYFADSAKDALDWVDTTSTGGKTVLRVSEEYLEKEKLEKYSASETGYGLAESLYDGNVPLEYIQIKVNDNGDEDDWWSLAQYLKNRKSQYNMLDQKTKKKVDKLVDEEDERRLKRRR